MRLLVTENQKKWFVVHTYSGYEERVRRNLEQRIRFMDAGPGGSILEIGPGRGVFADICIKDGMDYVAIEANRQMAESLVKELTGNMRPGAPEHTNRTGRNIRSVWSADEPVARLRDDLPATERLRVIQELQERGLL